MYALEEVQLDADRFRAAVEADQPYKPLYVKLKVTWACNLRCRMCNVWRQGRANALDADALTALINELADHGCQKVHLSGGEVLTRPDLFALIEACVRRDIRVNLTTNGTLITRDVALRLADSGVRSISVSLDSPERKTHDALRGDGAWKQTVRGMTYLRKAIDRQKAKARLRCNTVITRQNYQSLVGLADFAADLGYDCLTLIPVDDPSGELRLNKKRLVEFNESIAHHLAQKGLENGLFQSVADAYPFGMSGRDLEYAKEGLYARGLYQSQPCYAPWTHALVTPQGRVYACCMTRTLPRPLGNLSRQSFWAIWESERYRAFRQQSHRPTLYACQCCDDFLGANRALHALMNCV